MFFFVSGGLPAGENHRASGGKDPQRVETRVESEMGLILFLVNFGEIVGIDIR